MLSPHHDPTRTSRFRDVLTLGLVLGLGTLTVVVLQQRAEIRRLTRELAAAPERPGIVVRTTQARNLGVLLTPRTEPAARTAGPDALDGGPPRWAEAVRGGKSRAESGSILGRLLENPEFFQALERHRQLALDARFAGLFRRLALGPEELTAFKRLLAEKDNVALEVVAVAETQADGPLPAHLVTAGVRAARAKVDEAIRASLGSDRYAVYREYEQTQPQREVVAQLEKRLSYSGAPLEPRQAEALVQILAAHAPATAAPETSPVPAVVIDTGAPAAVARLQSDTTAARVSDSALAQAQTVLSPPQVAALRDIQVEQQASLVALQLIRDSLPPTAPSQDALMRLLLQ